jgi:hypothetical protein
MSNEEQSGFFAKPVLGAVKLGKCPIDGRENRPVFITYNNKMTLAMADGKGDAFKMYGDDYMQLNSKCLPENKYDPDEYEFDRGLSGFDF